MRTIYLGLFITFLFFESYSQSIEKLSVDSGGESISVDSIQILYTIGEVKGGVYLLKLFNNNTSVVKRIVIE